jgi:carbamoyl-phosphate synthase large subunit
MLIVPEKIGWKSDYSGMDSLKSCFDRQHFLNYSKKITYEYNSKEELSKIAKELNYSFIVRPSSVIGGRGMAIINSKEEFEFYDYVSSGIVNELLQDATEFDCDALRDASGNIFVCGVLEHIEYAGVHSGDSACVLPPYSVNIAIQKEIEESAYKIATKLGVIGLINIQFAVKNDVVYVIEANPRASRTVPFICKAYDEPYVNYATKVMLGHNKVTDFNFNPRKKGFAIKIPFFSFDKFPGGNKELGPEIKSTGESILFIDDLQDETFLKIYGERNLYLSR